MDLAAIVTDPRFGLTTSADAVERGGQLIPDKVGGATSRESHLVGRVRLTREGQHGSTG